jgi:hypothetical protein
MIKAYLPYAWKVGISHYTYVSLLKQRYGCGSMGPIRASANALCSVVGSSKSGGTTASASSSGSNSSAVSVGSPGLTDGEPLSPAVSCSSAQSRRQSRTWTSHDWTEKSVELVTLK